MMDKIGQHGALRVMAGLEETAECNNGFAEGKAGPVRGVRESAQEESERAGLECCRKCITLVIWGSYRG